MPDVFHDIFVDENWRTSITQTATRHQLVGMPCQQNQIDFLICMGQSIHRCRKLYVMINTSQTSVCVLNWEVLIKENLNWCLKGNTKINRYDVSINFHWLLRRYFYITSHDLQWINPYTSSYLNINQGPWNRQGWAVNRNWMRIQSHLWMWTGKKDARSLSDLNTTAAYPKFTCR